MLSDRLQRAVESEARRALAAALSPVPGAKAILVDDTLYDARLSVARPLDLFADPAFLREHGIRAVVPLSAHAARSNADALAQPSLVILIRAINATAARHAVKAIRLVRQRAATAAATASASSAASTAAVTKRPRDAPVSVGGAGTTVHPSGAVPSRESVSDTTPKCIVLTTPRRSSIVEKVLRSAGIPDVPVAPLPLGFLPFDADLVTLDWPEAFRQIVLDGDNSAILATAAALSSLASVLNLDFATIRSAGAAATAVAEELLHTHGEKYPHANPNAADRVPSSPSSPSSVAPSDHAYSFSPNDAFVLPEGVGEAAHGISPKDAYIYGEGGGEDDDEGGAAGSAMTFADVVGRGEPRRGVTLVLVDRGIDMVSPMLTQWTYEGLLDEAVGLHNNVMDLPVSSIISEDAIGILSAGPNSSGTVRKRLRSDVDRIFAQLRDLNYWTAARQLSSVASSVRDYYDQRPTRETAEISQVKDYVKGLREVKSEHLSAAAHTAIAAEISARTFDSIEFKRRFELEREMIEGSTATGRRMYVTDAIAKGECLSHVIRLCCLWSVTSGGIDAEELDFVKREILANFGLGVLPLLGNLERAGMLVRCSREPATTNLSWIALPRLVAAGTGSDDASTPGSGGSGARSAASGSDEGRRLGAGGTRHGGEYSWQFARAALRLVTEFDPEREVRAGTAAAVSAPYSGYTPLSVRLVETGLSDEGWAGLPHVATHTSLLPPGHATVEHRRGRGVWAAGGGGTSSGRVRGAGAHAGGTVEERIDAVVVMVGGMARAEASAVRLAAKAAGVRAIIATTAVMGPDEFVVSLNDRISSGT